ncbi:MAG TPA: WYL domain-containing protein [Ktedonobacteraceae bacterium]|nr:WYL domain-containing protein [Ktedonobacteraceae bacterium]
MRADRLLALLLLLQTRGRMTAHELAEQLEVSERTIYRDMEALSVAGIPVYAERGPGGGCSLIDGYQTRLTGLTATEVRALFLLRMASPLADLGLNKALDDALLKLSASLPVPQRNDAEQVRQRIHLDSTTWNANAETMCHLHTIQEAIWQERVLVLSYRESHSSCCEQLVEPYGLVSKGSAWYLVGVASGESKVFHVSRVATVMLTAEHFTRPAGFDLPRYWSEYCQQVPARRPNRQAQQKKRISLVHPSQQPQQKKTVSPARHQHRQPQQKKAILISTPAPLPTQSKEKNRLLHSLQSVPRQQLKKINFPRPSVLTSLLACA